VESCAAEAADATAEMDQSERAALEEALGFGTKGARPRQAAAAIKGLEEQQKARAKRLQRDAIDRALTELTTYHRDVLTLQTGAGARLINADLEHQLSAAARSTSAETTVRRIDAILACRTALETNVAPLLAVEAMMIALVEAQRFD
jgi:DNA polymerase-3 subunit delta'